MLLYEYRVRDEFVRVHAVAERLRVKFGLGTGAEELLADAQNLTEQCTTLIAMLPPLRRDRGSLQSHLGWMDKRLCEGNPAACESDIHDICERDLPGLEQAFRDWCAGRDHYDSELAEKTVDLLVQQRFTSAIREAFPILKRRLMTKYGCPANLDGPDLVNYIFGSKGVVEGLSEKEKQGLRDLLTGLYLVFRNTYVHNDIEASWHEVEAALSGINFALKRLDPR